MHHFDLAADGHLLINDDNDDARTAIAQAVAFHVLAHHGTVTVLTAPARLDRWFIVDNHVNGSIVHQPHHAPTVGDELHSRYSRLLCGGTPPPRLLFIVDSLDFLPRSEVEAVVPMLTEIGQAGRSSRMHFVCLTSNLAAAIIPTRLRDMTVPLTGSQEAGAPAPDFVNFIAEADEYAHALDSTSANYSHARRSGTHV